MAWHQTGDKPLSEPMLTPPTPHPPTPPVHWRIYASLGEDELTHLPLDKMAAMLADYIFKCIFLNENDRIRIQISMKYVPRSPIDNKTALVQVMAWRRTGDKPLPWPMMTQFIDTYIWH